MQHIPTELANHIFANHGISLHNAAVCVLAVAAAQYQAMCPALAYQYARDAARGNMRADIDAAIHQLWSSSWCSGCDSCYGLYLCD